MKNMANDRFHIIDAPSLPTEIWNLIFLQLNFHDRNRVSRVCRYFARLCRQVRPKQLLLAVNTPLERVQYDHVVQPFHQTVDATNSQDDADYYYKFASESSLARVNSLEPLLKMTPQEHPFQYLHTLKIYFNYINEYNDVYCNWKGGFLMRRKGQVRK